MSGVQRNERLSAGGGKKSQFNGKIASNYCTNVYNFRNDNLIFRRLVFCLTSNSGLEVYSNTYLVWGVAVVGGAALVLFLLVPTLKKWMNGIH